MITKYMNKHLVIHTLTITLKYSVSTVVSCDLSYEVVNNYI